MSKNFGIILTIDTTVNAAYVRLSDEPVASTVEVNDDVAVDLDEHNIVVGIEVLDEAAVLPFTELVDRFHVHTDVVEQLRIIRPDVASYVKITSGNDARSRASSATPVTLVSA